MVESTLSNEPSAAPRLAAEPELIEPDEMTTEPGKTVPPVGAAAVVNDASRAAACPVALVATMWKWYVVDGARPVSTAETGCALDPDPALALVVEEP